LHVEQIVADAVRLDLPQHGKVDIDDVLVAGQHQALFGHVPHGAAAAQAILDLMKAKMAYGEVWRKLHDKSQAPVPDEKDEKTALRKAQRAEAEPPTDGTNPPLEETQS
jgi:hypothetical protein